MNYQVQDTNLDEWSLLEGGGLVFKLNEDAT